MEILRTEGLGYSYPSETGKRRALENIDISVEKGEFVCILGHNGSGKSTLAKLMNALMLPDEGRVLVCGMDTKKESELWNVRRHAGMVFQNPDNQIVSSIVEEDVAFGPENLGMERDEIIKVVHRALKAVGMLGYEKNSPAMLSGGQKQRIAIAGVLAMLPDIIIFDEPTAMLDPKGRREVMDTIHTLNKKLEKTIILITHYMDETVDADRIIVMENGGITAAGTPAEVFAQRDIIESAGLSLPVAAQVFHELKGCGVEMTGCPITKEALVEELCSLL